MTDLLNQKIKTSFDKEQSRALVSGMYAFNATTGKWNYANVDDNGDLKVNIHAATGGGDLKARTDIADPATSTFLKCNTDGTLEMTAELSTAGLATSAIQTDGSQKCQILGNTEGDGSGDAKHIHTDATGNVLSQVVNTISIQPSNDTNSKLTDDPTKSVAVGLKGRQTIGSAATETFIKCNASGALAVEVATNSAEIKAEDDTGAARNVRCNNSGHVKSACIGAESDGTLRQIQTNEVGQLKTKLVADDGATRREVRCNSSGQLEVKADITNTTIATTTSKTTTVVSLYSGGSITIPSGGTSFQDFANGTVGTGTFTQLNVNGLGDVQYLVEGSGSSPSLTIQELIGTTASLGFVSQTSGFISGSEDFAVNIADSKAQHRGLRITNNSGGNTFTISSISAIYHA